MNALYVFMVLAMLGACGWVVWNKTGAVMTVVTTQNKDHVADAMTAFLTSRKYLQQSRSENLLTFAMDQRASCLITLILFLFFVIPAILYAILGGTTKTLSIHFTPHQTGWLVRLEGQRGIVRRLAKMVAVPVPTVDRTIVQTTEFGGAPLDQAPQVMPQGQIEPSPPMAQLSPAQYTSQAGVPEEAPRQAAPTSNLDIAEVRGEKFCTSCGNALRPGKGFCSNCGSPV